MRTEQFNDLKDANPPTVSLASANGDYVVPEIWWNDEDTTFGYLLKPVVAWITRNNIIPELRDYINPFAALVIDDEFGLIAHDDKLLESSNTTVLHPMLRSEALKLDYAAWAERKTQKKG